MKRKPPAPVASLHGLPAELLAGPDVTVWALGEVAVPAWSDDTPEQHRRSTAWHAWNVAGAEWGAAQGLPHLGWTKLLPPELAYVAKSLGRAHVIDGGLGPPWQWRSA